MSNSLNFDPRNLLLFAALGIGAYWLTTRRAAAATTGTPAATAGQFFTSPAQGPAPTFPGQNNNAALFTAGVGLVRDLFGLGNSRGVAQSTQSDGNAGEAAAQVYYQTHRDDFAAVTPSTYTTYTADYGGIDGM